MIIGKVDSSLYLLPQWKQPLEDAQETRAAERAEKLKGETSTLSVQDPAKLSLEKPPEIPAAQNSEKPKGENPQTKGFDIYVY